MGWLRKALKVALVVIKKADIVLKAIQAAIELIDPPEDNQRRKTDSTKS